MEIASKTEEWLHLPETGVESSRLNTIGFVWLLFTAITANLLLGGVNSAALGVLSLMLTVSVVLWIADSLYTKRLKYPTSLLLLPFLALIVLGVIQLLPLGSNPVEPGLISVPSTTALSIEPFETRLSIFKLVLFLTFFSGALIYLDSPKRLRATVFVLVFFGGLMSFIGILQKLSTPNVILWIRQIDFANPFATYVNQHHFAAFLVMTIALTMGLLFAGSTRPDKRLLLIIAAVLMGFGVVFTTSRGALISLIAALAFLSFLNLRSGRSKKASKKSTEMRSKTLGLIGANVLLIAFLLVSVAWLGGSDLVLRQTGLESKGEFTSGRIEFWSNTLEIVKDNPILGTGLGSFGTAYSQYDEWNGTLKLAHAHNDYLEILSDGGIVGFLCVATFVVLLFRKGLKMVSGAQHPNQRGITAGALAACFGILVHSFFDFPLQTYANMFFFLICAALATVPVEFPPVKRQKKIKRVKRRSA